MLNMIRHGARKIFAGECTGALDVNLNIEEVLKAGEKKTEELAAEFDILQGSSPCQRSQSAKSTSSAKTTGHQRLSVLSPRTDSFFCDKKSWPIESKSTTKSLSIQTPSILRKNRKRSRRKSTNPSGKSLEHLANRFVTKARNRPETICILGNLFSYNERRDKATTYFSRAVQICDSDFTMLSTCWDTTLRYYPKNATVWLYMGQIRHKKGELNKALQCFNKALQFDPTQANALFMKANMYYNLGDYRKSLNELIHLDKIHPKLGRNHHLRHTIIWGRNISATSICKLLISSIQKEITSKKVKLLMFSMFQLKISAHDSLELADIANYERDQSMESSISVTPTANDKMIRTYDDNSALATTSPRLELTPLSARCRCAWRNQIQLNLSDFTQRAYGTNYIETLRVQIHANCRIRRVYFFDQLYSEDELPAEFKLYHLESLENITARAEQNYKSFIKSTKSAN
ncbi:Oidioi.mRNA.OKI2018_I69.PAR.g13220.t1.cds [Oikopleura dioica]|uniref:Oidioi.mRNA.OKI2018_I69.PAR.g13220.t1.cds n=1 Tax=Oikopleura dioica TaxID=34765 RepID=A0ABN7S943_OIKDI|nr:Oidioi.mRNA.OKI2018_I69.PAR.g13220.t1.cds [Oikopleura dioica]